MLTPIVPKITKKKNDIIRMFIMLMNEETKASSEILNPSYYLISLRGLRILNILNILKTFS